MIQVRVDRKEGGVGETGMGKQGGRDRDGETGSSGKGRE